MIVLYQRGCGDEKMLDQDGLEKEERASEWLVGVGVDDL